MTSHILPADWRFILATPTGRVLGEVVALPGGRARYRYFLDTTAAFSSYVDSVETAIAQLIEMAHRDGVQ